MTMELLEIKGLSLRFGGIIALANLQVIVKEGRTSCGDRSERRGQNLFVQLY